jgi:hypothetical protein
MQEIYQEYGYALSPRGINKKTLLGFDPREIVEAKGLSREYLILCPKCRRYDYGEKARR